MTPRQYEICLLVAQGLRNKEIADALGISMSTVKAHMLKAYAATQSRNRVVFARHAKR